jgi:hypothetical protein
MRSALVVEERAVAAIEVGPGVTGWGLWGGTWGPPQRGRVERPGGGGRTRPKAIVHTSFWEHFALVRRQLTEVGVVLQV